MNFRAFVAGLAVAVIGVGIAVASDGSDSPPADPSGGVDYVTPATPVAPEDPNPTGPENIIGEPPDDARIAECKEIVASGPDAPTGDELHACEVQLAQVAGYLDQGEKLTEAELDAALSDYEQAK